MPQSTSMRKSVVRSQRVRSLLSRASAMEPLEGRTLLSTTWYVSTAGADTGAGTSLTAPLRTIQKAASLAQPGDTVLIRGGTYRETVRPQRSGTNAAPIAFKSYNGEVVTVSGADLVTGWTNQSAKVYKAGQGWDLGVGANQVFVDSQMILEARWPNASLDLSHPTKASADAVTVKLNGAKSTATLRDAALTQPDGYWNGATISFAAGQAWVSQTATVTDYRQGKLTFTFNYRGQKYEIPEAGDQFYLTGKFNALDAAGEWFRDGSGSLFLRTPQDDSPTAHVVEAKRRDYAFDLRGRSNVTVEGINLFASTITTDSASSHIVLRGLDARYVSHYTQSVDGWDVMRASGIELLGSNSVLENSVIAYSAGNGVRVLGTGNVVRNNIIHDVDYSGGDAAGVNARGSDQLITRNTIYNAGRSGVKFSNATRTDVTYNLIHDVGLQATDLGGVYTFGTNGQGSEVAYNIIYNVHTGGFGGAGVYLDNGSNNWSVHHNVVYAVDHGVKMNPSSRYNQIYNNTLAAEQFSVASSKSRDMTGSSFKNNIFTKKTDIGPGASQTNNLAAGATSLFMDAAHGDFRLRSASVMTAASSGGKILASGVASAVKPTSVGALEYGRDAFKAGAGSDPKAPAPKPRVPSSAPSPTPTPTPNPTPTPAPKPTVKRNAKSFIQAEKADATNNVRVRSQHVGYTASGSWLKYGGIDFGSGVSQIKLKIAVANENAGRRIEIRVGGATGTLVGTLVTQATGGWGLNTLKTEATTVTGLKGVQDIYLVFQGGSGVANVDGFTFA